MEQSISNIISAIEKAISGFQSTVPGVQKIIFDELQPIIKNFDIKDGKLLNNVTNLKKIGELKNKLEKIILSAQYKDAVKDFIGSFATVSDLQTDYFAQFNKKFRAKKTLPIIKELAINATINNLVGNGLSSFVVEPIQKILNQNITTGGSYAKFQEQLRNHILTNDTGEGSLERYTKQITTDAINQYNAQYHEAIAQDLQFNWGRYVGSNITTSREFCLLLTKKQWVHKSELPEVLKGHIDNDECKLSKTTGLPLGMITGTNTDNFKVLRGGYNCGHQFFWVPDSAVPDAIQRKFIEPKPVNNAKVDLEVLKQGNWGTIYNNKTVQDRLAKVHSEITKEEKSAVFAYSGNEYYSLNKSLRGEAKISPYNENLKTLLSQAIDGMKSKHVGWVFRGTRLSSNDIKKYKDAFDSKTNIKHEFFTSTSHQIGSAFSGNVKYSIYSKRGVLIEKLSDHEHEKEVLINVGTEFKIISLREEQGVTYIKMEEI